MQDILQIMRESKTITMKQNVRFPGGIWPKNLNLIKIADHRS